MTQNLQLAGVMASILGLMAVSGLTIGARFQTTPTNAVVAEVQPIASPSAKRVRRVRTPKVEVRLTYDGVSWNPGDDENASPSVAVSEPAAPGPSNAECSACAGLSDDEAAARADNSGFANLALPYFSAVDEELR